MPAGFTHICGVVTVQTRRPSHVFSHFLSCTIYFDRAGCFYSSLQRRTNDTEYMVFLKSVRQKAGLNLMCQFTCLCPIYTYTHTMIGSQYDGEGRQPFRLLVLKGEQNTETNYCISQMTCSVMMHERHPAWKHFAYFKVKGTEMEKGFGTSQ